MDAKLASVKDKSTYKNAGELHSIIDKDTSGTKISSLEYLCIYIKYNTDKRYRTYVGSYSHKLAPEPQESLVKKYLDFFDLKQRSTQDNQDHVHDILKYLADPYYFGLYLSTLKLLEEKGIYTRNEKDFVFLIKSVDASILVDNLFINNLYSKYVNILKYYMEKIQVETLCNIVLFTNHFQPSHLFDRYNSHKYDTVKSNIDALLKSVQMYKLVIPSTASIEKAYKSSLYISVEILSTGFQLEIPIPILMKYGTNISSSHKAYLTKYINKVYKKDHIYTRDEFEFILKFNMDNAETQIKQMIANHTLDVDVHGPIIVDNLYDFTHLTADFLKQLSDYGIQLNQKIVESLCKCQNIALLRGLIEKTGLHFNQKCLENACTIKNNSKIIEYIISEGVSPNLQCIINYSKACGNQSMTDLIEKYISATGASDLRPIYSDDE